MTLATGQWDNTIPDYYVHALAAEYGCRVQQADVDQGGYWLAWRNLACWYPSLAAVGSALLCGDTPRGRMNI